MSFDVSDRAPVTAYRRDETREFMFPKGNDPIEISVGETISVQPFAENLEVADQMTAYLGFEKVGFVTQTSGSSFISFGYKSR